MCAPPAADGPNCDDRGVALVVSAYLDHHWRAFTDTIAAPALFDDPRFRTSRDRVGHRDELLPLLATRTAGDWLPLFEEAGLLVGVVRDYAESPRIR